MGKALAAAMLFSCVLFMISACSPSPAADEPDLFEYEGATVGNNSAVLNTLNRLPGAENLTGFEL